MRIPNLSLNPLLCSAAHVEPKKPFFVWLEGVFKERGLRVDQIYFPEENPVWLIPRIASFRSHDDYTQFVKLLKIRLMRGYLRGFVEREDEFPKGMTEEDFDRFFDLKLHDEVFTWDDLNQSKDGSPQG